ncbi:MAG: YfcE family phosphodiesterase [Ruminiclostridium sp.]|nr:YfcE family phosphodiesterase [Ruminiclostridium sp.]
MKLVRVRGNCDRSEDLPFSQIIDTVPGPDDRTVRILAVHGHLCGVDSGTGELLRQAHENDCGIALFGHTHCRFEQEEDGVLIINPGSCARPRDNEPPSYAYIDITAWGVISGIVDLMD